MSSLELTTSTPRNLAEAAQEVTVRTGFAEEHYSFVGGAGLNGVVTAEVETGHENFTKDIPSFAEQLGDETRTNTFSYVPIKAGLWMDDRKDDDPVVTMTEHEGLQGLHDFLVTFIKGEEEKPNNEPFENFARDARSILENLSFVGERELQEAVRGLAAGWKTYLDGDPKRQICVPSLVSKEKGMRKSDIRLFEAIMDTFSDEELDAYQGRIVTEFDAITATPEDVKVLLLDDWTISGEQLQDSYAQIATNPDLQQYADSVEIQLVIASKQRLEEGLPTDKRSWVKDSKRLPVTAYYRAREATGANPKEAGAGAHITGIHSSVDFNFERLLSRFVDIQRRSSPAQERASIVMPPLSNIVRDYRYDEPRITVAADGSIERHVTDSL